VEEPLLDWHRTARRDLPWRRTRDPYLVLVSEVMLQQTQVARVIPRWEGWVRRWPSVRALAGASRADVIREWQGLGYNRRAVALHEAARRVAARGWPADLTELPGVGRYTANAVARFALGREVLPVDVNVRRVLERSGGTFSPRAAEALMDLGATVCVARVPRCIECPLAGRCPSSGARFEPARRQGRFEGSSRQRRARLLRSVTAGGPLPGSELDAVALRSLVRDGLIVADGGRVRLPD
jgi:A/G-specific adenine glycosylase